jgi:TRAP-type uncharacterized transport system fused permease subunit
MIRVNPYESPADAADHQTFDWPRAFETIGYVAFVVTCYVVTAPLWAPLALLAIVVLILIGLVWLPYDAVRRRDRESAAAALLLWASVALVSFFWWDDCYNDHRLMGSIEQHVKSTLRPIRRRSIPTPSGHKLERELKLLGPPPR